MGTPMMGLKLHPWIAVGVAKPKTHACTHKATFNFNLPLFSFTISDNELILQTYTVAYCICLHYTYRNIILYELYSHICCKFAYSQR